MQRFGKPKQANPNDVVTSADYITTLITNLLSHGTPSLKPGTLEFEIIDLAKKGGVGKKTPQVIKENKKLKKKQDVPIEEETQIVKKLTKPKVKKVKKLTENQ